MKKSILFFTAFALSLLWSGCDEFLDTTPTNKISDKIVWNDIKVATMYSNIFYAYLDRYGLFSTQEDGNSQFNGNLTEGLTETFKYGSRELGGRNGDANWIATIPEQINPSSDCRLTIWGPTYNRIRRVNEFLVGLYEFSTFDEQTNRLFEAQARFFRAFLYFQLARRHGGVILYTDMNLVKDKNRSSAEDTWNLIESDLDFAASVLPVTWDAENEGRITRGAVFAFKSRAMLYAERWQSAKNAADSVFALNKYALTPNYADAWKGSNSESILEYKYLISGPSHRFDRDYAPFGDIVNEGGKGGPTQELVESYEKANGTTVDWSPWHSTTTTPPPYDQLEPRFHATVIYNGCTWKGKIMENSVNGTNGRYMEYKSESYPQGRTVTGYYLRKLLNEAHINLTSDASTQTMVEIRLAEVYLNRAEANYRLNVPAAALADLNAIRTRTGVNLPPKTGLTGDALFDAIRQERKIELACEGHLYWDMRRWRLAHEDYPKGYNNYRVHGLKITGTAPNYTYEYVDCDKEDRKFLAKTYVLPIPYSELQNNNAVEQYNEWK
ncbi:MAG: RagB/SusD family nutrient uptake outer membrane protein [Prevotellaceae bacterium]|jgi:hypothetical protein|nr:RagB/SusD family nutrient uptake outer membrane protein [Prevotellaceae bacterium]